MSCLVGLIRDLFYQNSDNVNYYLCWCIFVPFILFLFNPIKEKFYVMLASYLYINKKQKIKKR